MKVSKAILLAGLVASLVSCGRDEQEGMTPTQTMRTIAVALCERAFECSGSAPEPLDYATVAECADEWLAGTGANQAAIEASIEAGRISWDADDAEYCARLVAEALGDLSCENYWNENEAALGVDDPRCDTLGAGLVADGDACTIDDDCASVGSDCIDDVCTPE